jgi:hypothetical protein
MIRLRNPGINKELRNPLISDLDIPLTNGDSSPSTVVTRIPQQSETISS